jgi:hypothetical protein
MELIKDAAISFGSPAMTACHPLKARQQNTTLSILVVMMAAYRAHLKPLAMKTPQRMLRLPNRPPLNRAVFAFSGFDAKPSRPTTMRKTPYPIVYFQVNVLVAYRKGRISSQATRNQKSACERFLNFEAG